jgi:ribosomal 50S subunit-recycling heat shock protein
MRLDKFLQLSRLVKRRTLAHTLCEAGRVRLNGAAAKPAASVKPGDVITISRGDRRLVAKVLTVPDRSTSSKEFVEILGRVDIGEWERGVAGSRLQ